MTLLAHVVDTSSRVGSTASRLLKVRELAACLRTFSPAEIEIGVPYLCGDTRQGRFGIGYAALRAASTGTAAATPSLSLLEVDRRLQQIAAIRGAGATGQR